MKSQAHFVIVLAALAVATTSQGQSFSDATFNDLDWSEFSNVVNTGSFTAVQAGNSANIFRRVSFSMSPNSAIGVTHYMNSSATVIGSGGLGTINFSIDHVKMDGMGYGLAFLVFQNGVSYIADHQIYAPNTILTKSSIGLSENDFSEVTMSLTGVSNSASKPDFDLVGSTISFGFFTSGVTTNTSGESDIYFDNFSVSAEAVPEPASMALIALPALIALRKKKSR